MGKGSVSRKVYTEGRKRDSHEREGISVHRAAGGNYTPIARSCAPRVRLLGAAGRGE